jgi:hypothetical protein
MVATASAADLVCGDTTRALYEESAYGGGAIPSGCAVVPKAETAAQRVLIATPAAHGGAKCSTLGACYIKRAGTAPTDNLAVEMTLGEKQAVDTAIQAVQDAAAALATEKQTNEVCSGATLANITTYITNRKNTKLAQLGTITDANETAINNLSGTVTLTMLKNALLAMNNHVENVATELLNEQADAALKIAKCLRAIVR